MPCTTVLAGRLATNDRSTMIARTDDGHFDEKKLIVVEPDQQPKIYKSVESHVEITLPENPMRYTSCPSVDPTHGIWAATGINAANVGMTATETTTSNPRVLAADPLVELQKAEDGKEERCGGIGEEDIVVLVLPYIHSAREGVLRLGSLLEQYGIDALICGAVSDEERRAAGMAGLMLFPGASGKADDAALGFLSGSVVSDPSNHCNACGFKSACSLKDKGGCGK